MRKVNVTELMRPAQGEAQIGTPSDSDEQRLENPAETRQSLFLPLCYLELKGAR